ncbi:MAG: hypothetical protein ACFCVE_15385 [Phycisphaerae bacterium]
MSSFPSLPLPGLSSGGSSSVGPPSGPEGRLEQVMPQKPLRRVMAFAGCDIDDVVNSRVAKNRVLACFKTGRWIERQVEIGDLERQWNPLGRVG